MPKLDLRLPLFLLALLVTSTIVGIALIALANLLPDEPIKENIASSISKIHRGQHPVFGTHAEMDHFTECLYVTSGMRTPLEKPSEPRSLHNAMVDAITSPTLGPCKAIQQQRNGFQYYRYWFGGLIITRPVLSVTTLPTLRALVFVLFVCSLLYYAFSVGKHISWYLAFSVLAIVAASPLYSQLFLVPHASPWLIGFITGGLAVSGRVHSNKALASLFLLSGIGVAYFDILTNPIVAPVAALLAITLQRWKSGKNASFLQVGLLLAVWLFGYFGFWALKWALAAMVLGPESVIHNVLRASNHRLSGDVGPNEATVFMSLALNGRAMFAATLVAIGATAMAILLSNRHAAQLTGHRRPPAQNSAAIVAQMLAIASLPVIWLLVFKNHSIVHIALVAPILTWTLIGLAMSAQLARSPTLDQPATETVTEQAATKH